MLSLKKVGGIWFIKLGRMRLFFCVCKKPVEA